MKLIKKTLKKLFFIMCGNDQNSPLVNILSKSKLKKQSRLKKIWVKMFWVFNNFAKNIKYISVLEIIDIDDDVIEVIVVMCSVIKWIAKTKKLKSNGYTKIYFFLISMCWKLVPPSFQSLLGEIVSHIHRFRAF